MEILKTLMHIKKLLLMTLMLLSLSAFAQNNIVDKALSRFTDPENPDYSVFLAKGGKAFGIVGSYWLFNVNGENPGDGYSFLSLLKVGGSARMDQVSIARDIDAIGIQVGYVRYILPKNKRK